MTEEQVEEDVRGMRVMLAVVLAGIVVGGTVDLVLDAPDTWRSGHVLFEVGLILAALATAVWLWRNWRHAATVATALERSLAERQAERDAWRERAAQALSGLGLAVGRQFHDWALTPAEQEVALLLLKGRSHKEVAAATGRSERTVRQHAVAAYHKAGLGGRAELAAFFLGDLALPSEEAPPSSDSPGFFREQPLSRWHERHP
jgi:DNA-binding CsgD family transcriptional regulator